MPTTAKPKAPVAPSNPNAPAPNAPVVDLHLEGVKDESIRIKELMDKRYKKLVDAFNKEVNIATRYELKLRIDELQETYQMLFMKGE